jgi:hypothetical protein
MDAMERHLRGLGCLANGPYEAQAAVAPAPVAPSPRPVFAPQVQVAETGFITRSTPVQQEQLTQAALRGYIRAKVAETILLKLPGTLNDAAKLRVVGAGLRTFDASYPNWNRAEIEHVATRAGVQETVLAKLPGDLSKETRERAAVAALQRFDDTYPNWTEQDIENTVRSAVIAETARSLFSWLPGGRK